MTVPSFLPATLLCLALRSARASREDEGGPRFAPPGLAGLDGGGKRVFGEARHERKLRLASAETAGDGISLLTYERVH